MKIPLKKHIQVSVDRLITCPTKDLLSGKSTNLVTKHKYHPPSKVFVSFEKNKKKSINTTFFNEKMGEDFKLAIHAPIPLKKTDNFMKFYSGGPSKLTKSSINLEEIPKLSNIEIKRIIQIQKLIRGVITRKKNAELISKFKSVTKEARKAAIRKTLMMRNSCFSYLQEEDYTAQYEKEKFARKKKGLTLKQRKLFEAAKLNNFFLVGNSGFKYFENDVNGKDHLGNSPLYYVCQQGNEEFCKFLIDHKANPNQKCSKGNTPTHMAFSSQKFEVISLFQ